MREIKLKYLCKSFSNAIAAKELNSEATNGYPVYGAAGLMGYKDSYDTDVEYLGIVKDGAGIGRINVYPAKSSLLGTMATIIPNNNVDIKWLQYAISNLNLGESVDKATIPHIYFSVYGNSYIRDISISDQQKIAAHLDRKCTQIDALISNAQQQIEKLKAYKQSVITETVTKGLDPEVEMKDSGIEWIGIIPETWRLSHIGNLAQIGSGGTPNRNNPEYWKDGTIPWMSSGEINLEYVNDTAEKITELGMMNSNAKLLPVHTVMLGLIGQGKTKGLTAILNIECTCNQNLAYLIPNKFLYYKYLFYCFKSMYVFIRGIVGESQAGIYQGFLKKQYIPLPSFEEQEQICDYLDERCEKIDRLIAIKQQKIEKLQQYKKSLIYEYVTGKKEVS